jgi:hypothetical protein
MREQFTTFQLPPKILMMVQNYYEKMDNNIKAARSYSSDAGPAVARIFSDTDNIRNTVVAYIEDGMNEIRTKLEAKGIDIR